MESSSSGYERRKLDGDELPSEYLAAKRREKLNVIVTGKQMQQGT